MDPLAQSIAALHAEGRLRVWSLVVTILGDVAEPRGGSIAAADLQDLVTRLGVSPGTLRTALSRLAADDWILREGSARARRYRFGPRGIAEYSPAARRIYAAPAFVDDWSILIHPKTDVAAADGIALAPGVWLVPGMPPRGVATAVTGRLSGDLGGFERLPSNHEHRQALVRLAVDITALTDAAETCLTPIDAIATRVLLIHHWRRHVLRHPDLPDLLLPTSLAGLRQRTATLYRKLLPVSECWPRADEADLALRITTLSRRFETAG